MINIFKLAIIFNVFFFNALSAKIDVKGRVLSGGEALPGVNILVIETLNGTVSNKDGGFDLTFSAEGAFTVRFSAVGYKTKFVKLDIARNYNETLIINLETTSIEIDVVEVLDSRIQNQSDTRTSLINLQPKSARNLPGAVTDVFRSLQSLPGVLAPNDFSSQLIVRGSGPDQNLIIMDDVEVFNPYRLYGVISMFNPEAVSDISLITGGFPSRYGDRLSAVIDVTNRQGNFSRSISGSINASIVSANIVLEGKNPFNIPGSWLINSRRTYYDLIIEPFVKNTGLVEEDVSFPNFYDLQTKLAFGPFNGNKFFVNGILSRDGVKVISSEERVRPDSIGVVDLTKNDLLSFAWHFAPGKNILNKFILSWYRNAGDSDFDSELLDPSVDRNQFEDIAPDTLKPYLLGFGVKSDYIFRKYSVENRLNYFGEDFDLEAGAGLDFIRTNILFDFEIDPELQAVFNQNRGFRSALDDLDDQKDYFRAKFYIQNNFKLSEAIAVQPGIRFDYYDIMKKFYAAPRISAAYAVDNVTTLRGVWGIYYQSFGYEKLRDANKIFDFDRRYTEALKAEKSSHYVLSIERWLNNKWLAKFETYFKNFGNLIESKTVSGTAYSVTPKPGMDLRFLSGWNDPVRVIEDSTTTIPINASKGNAYGFELLIEKKNIYGDDRLSGWISYALAYAERLIDGRTIPFRFDQRHTANLVLNYRINSWLELGARFQYGTGFPLTEAIGIVPRIILADLDQDNIPESPVIATRGNTDRVIFDVDYGGKFNRLKSRKPDYHRLDMRVNAKANYWGLDWNFYLDIINVYNRSNVINYDYFVTDNLELKRRATNMLPILPTLGFSVRF